MSEKDNNLSADELAGLERREPKAIERWFLHYADAVYTFAFYRVNKDTELATDIVQETFLIAINQITDYNADRGEMLTWLTYLSKNCIRKALKQRGRSSQIWDKLDEQLLHDYEQIAQSPLPQDTLERQETTELVHMTLASIPGHYQEVLRKHYYENQPLKDIAQTLDLKESAVKALLHRARQAFKTAFGAFAQSLAVPVASKARVRK
jgi:RNA polymerase sigma-70 factor (ECF subfamily)